MTKSRASCSLILAATIATLQIDAVFSSSNGIPKFPEKRYKPWSHVDWLTRNDARYLLFTPENWNGFLTGPLERMTYEQVAEFMGLNNPNYRSQWQKTTNALENIAIDSKTWDCWINHYIGNEWDDLRRHNVSWAFRALGWNRTTWRSDNPADWPDTEDKSFDQLSVRQTRAAERICCPAEIWDGIPLDQWEYNDDGISTALLKFEAKYPPPTPAPTKNPTLRPTRFPTISPVATADPSASPTDELSESPTTSSPSSAPSTSPSKQESPSATPSDAPIGTPSASPVAAPSAAPSDSPIGTPSASPVATPSGAPSDSPIGTPSASPIGTPSASPTTTPSASPIGTPSAAPTTSPSASPIASPSGAPNPSPSAVPTVSPSASPSAVPTISPSASPSMLNCPANFTLVLLTDKYPKETSWVLRVVDTENWTLAKSLGYNNDFETHHDTMCIQFDQCYIFEIRDKWDDGICCENGQGSYAGFIQYPGSSSEEPVPIPGLNGGAFETKERHTFCLDENGDLAESDLVAAQFIARNGGN